MRKSEPLRALVRETSLSPGDLILFDKETNTPLVAKVNGMEKFEVFAGTYKDRLTVQVASIKEDENE